jgi:DNA modification methylase
LALALQADGWWLRSDIIWAKPNPMPESVTDRPTKAHEYVFLLTKSARYFYDAEAVKTPSINKESLEGHRQRNKDKFVKHDEKGFARTRAGFSKLDGQVYPTRNRRTVWTIATQPFSAAHFATFPTALIEPMIKAGTSEKGCCPECGAPWERVVETHDPNNRLGTGYHDHTNDLGRGQRGVFSANGAPTKQTTGWRPTCAHNHEPIPCVVVDIFAGACTVGLVADRLGRDSIMMELNPEYAAMGEQRINNDAGWVADVEVEEPALRQLELL